MTKHSSEKRTEPEIKEKAKPARNPRPPKPEKLDFVQDFIPVKNIMGGVIETTDGRYIKILEIDPINFMLRSSEEQYGII